MFAETDELGVWLLAMKGFYVMDGDGGAAGARMLEQLKKRTYFIIFALNHPSETKTQSAAIRRREQPDATTAPPR